MYTFIQQMANIQITIDKKKYILADNVIRQCPVWCKGIRSGRDFVARKEIPANKWIYAKNVDDVWVVADGSSKRHDKAIVRRKYLMECQPYVDEIKGVNVRDANGIEIAPPVICLEEEEMFDDEQGNALEIETRGVRKCNGVYFRVKDVSKCFKIDSLYDTLIHAQTQYTEHVDYEYFIRQVPDPVGNKANKVTKEIFLTYEGMLRVLFISRSGNTRHFVGWATDTLFTVKMGTVPQKQALVGKMLGASPSAVNEVFRTSATTTPCIYLFVLGTVKALRESMRIDPRYSDAMLVCKYGYTNDLPRRTTEHTKTYGTIKGADLRLVHHSYIDPMYISKAEADIRLFFEGTDMELVYKTHKELVVVDQIASKLIAHQYKQLGDKYAGHSGDLKKRINDLEHLVALKEEQAINVAERANSAVERANHEVVLKDEQTKSIVSQKDNELRLCAEQTKRIVSQKDNELRLYAEQTKNIVLQKDIELMAKDNMIALLQSKLNRSKPKKTKKGSA
jgi:hypothetical protein